jgi:hypothetical protein
MACVQDGAVIDKPASLRRAGGTIMRKLTSVALGLPGRPRKSARPQPSQLHWLAGTDGDFHDVKHASAGTYGPGDVVLFSGRNAVRGGR